MGVRYLITHGLSANKTGLHKFVGVDKCIDFLGFIVDLSTPEWLSKNPWAFDVLDRIIPYGLQRHLMGFTIVSEEAGNHLETTKPLPEQSYSKFLHGSRPLYSSPGGFVRAHMQTLAYTICSNCGAYCQGWVDSGGCNMCRGSGGELFDCDCDIEGGIEPSISCAVHGDGGTEPVWMEELNIKDQF